MGNSNYDEIALNFIYENWQWFTGTILFGLFVTPRILNSFKHQKRIKIENRNIFNINNHTGWAEKFNTPKFFSNFIQAELTVHNKRDVTQSVTKIELFNINKKDSYFADIQFDGGFYDENQKFILLAYNNGNTEGDSEDTKIEIFAYEINMQNKQLLQEESISSLRLSSGEIKSIFIVDLKNIADDFKKNPKLFVLSICVQRDDVMEARLVFDRKKNRFYNSPMGAVAPPPDNFPIFDLTKDFAQQSVNCFQELTTGANNVSYLILVDRTCRLEFNEVLYIGNKKVKDKNKVKIDIRLPIYSQERGTFRGCFYWLVEKQKDFYNESVSYNLDIVQLHDKNLIYDKYRAARKFYDAKIY